LSKEPKKKARKGVTAQAKFVACSTIKEVTIVSSMLRAFNVYRIQLSFDP